MQTVRRWFWIVILVAMVVPAVAQTQGVNAGVTASVTITNDNCPAGVRLAQVIWLRGEQPIGLQILQITIRQGQRYTVEQKLKAAPTAVVVRGYSGSTPFEKRVPMGQTLEYACGTITATSAAQAPPTAPQPPSAPSVPLPSGMPRVTLSPGMSPDQLLNALRAAGAEVQVQGSQAKPKLGDAADPIIMGALPGGFAALGLWVSTAAGSLRAAVAYDHPNAFVWMWIVPVPNFWNAAMAWSPWPGGGIAVSLDRPQSYQPLTQWGNAPVPGNLFFILIIKWEMGPAPFPYVISLSN